MLIEFQISNGTDAIIVCGTTGEGSTLSVKERLDLFSYAVDKVHGRVPVIGGTGSNSTFFTRDLALEAEKTGIDAHLIVTPYYNKTSQEGIVKHYTFLGDTLTKPIIVYNVPSRTGMNIQPETYKKLSDHRNIVAVKEADPNINKLMKSISLCDGKLDFYIGNDDLITVSAYVGCKGVISVLSNILPRFTRDMTNVALSGKIGKANEMQIYSLELIDALFSDVNPIPVKEAMKILVSVMGYTPKAEQMGGYPHGYNRVAKELGIDKDLFFEGKKEAIRGDVMEMVNNSLDIPWMIEKVFGENVQYEIADGKNGEEKTLRIILEFKIEE